MSQLSRVNINLLITLQMLLEERSASSAATRLNLSQSTISKNLAQLRDLFNDPLFYRISHGLMPTKLALALEPKLKTALSAMENIFSPTEFDLALCQGCFRLSMHESAFEFIAAPLIQQVLTQTPEMHFDTWFKDSISIEQLNQGQLDFVILPHDIGQQPKLGNHLLIQELYRDDLVCLVSEHHPILQQTWDQTNYLASKHIHVRDNELGTPMFDKTLSKRGLHRNIVVQVPDFHAASSLCSQSDLIFTTTSSWAEFAIKHKPLVKISMPCPSLPVVYSLIWHQRSEVDPAHQWLKQQIIDTAMHLRN